MAVGLLMSEEEGFYGFGERFTATNQRGNRVGSWLEDGSWGLGVFDPATWKLRVRNPDCVQDANCHSDYIWFLR